MKAFAIYRLPRATQCVLVGEDDMPQILPSLDAVTGRSGFVIAPFTPSATAPVLLLRPSVLQQCSCDDVLAMDGLQWNLSSQGLPLQPADCAQYNDNYSRFHRRLQAGEFQKLVLARCADDVHNGLNPAQLFVRACNEYPTAFVTVFSAPQCGTWLMATPEVLLTRDGDLWRTMALAGTMRYDRSLSWSEKNMQEQAYVADYIGQCLAKFTTQVQMNGPYTVQAGQLEHLRTDFSFTLDDDSRLGALLAALHPTPAVCGLPKAEAHRFIIENEHFDRSYYSGFSGPLNLEGDTGFYVSLRCMRIFEDRCRLYAGGGLLATSEEESEWAETAAKMQTMKNLVN